MSQPPYLMSMMQWDSREDNRVLFTLTAFFIFSLIIPKLKYFGIKMMQSNVCIQERNCLSCTLTSLSLTFVWVLFLDFEKQLIFQLPILFFGHSRFVHDCVSSRKLLAALRHSTPSWNEMRFQRGTRCMTTSALLPQVEIDGSQTLLAGCAFSGKENISQAKDIPKMVGARSRISNESLYDGYCSPS